MPIASRYVFVTGCFLLLAVAVRLLLVEPTEMLVRCSTPQAAGDLLCTIRSAAVANFRYNILGIASLFCTVLAAIWGSRGFAWAGLMIGCLGLVLFCYEFSAAAAVGALLVLVSRPPKSDSGGRAATLSPRG